MLADQSELELSLLGQPAIWRPFACLSALIPTQAANPKAACLCLAKRLMK